MTGPQQSATEVSYDLWATTDDGEQVPQRSNPDTIERMIQLLDLSEGMRVLEIGTGSGYSSARLARSVGPAGLVVSVDIDRNLVERAARIHQGAGSLNVEVHVADGARGWPAAAPYDRIVAWTTPHLLPLAWASQAVTGAIILSPVKIATVALAHALVRCTIVSGRPADAHLYPGSFIEMTDSATEALTVPARYVDVVTDTRPGPPVWISADALHDRPAEEAAQLADQLARATPRHNFLTAAGHRDSFVAYLLASTDHPASAGTVQGWGIGVATPSGIAVVLPDGSLLAAGTGQATEDLTAARDRWARWYDPARSRYDGIAAVVRTDPDGWVVRSVLPTDARSQ